MRLIMNSIMEKFFKNPGTKIKNLAFWIFIVESVLSILGGIYMFFMGLSYIDEIGFLIIVGPVSACVGIGLSWLSNILIFGFGELIENTSQSKDQPPTPRETTPIPDYQTPNNLPISYWRCENCGSKNGKFEHFCSNCGNAKTSNSYSDNKDYNSVDKYWFCKKCGHRNLNDDNSCPNCGFSKNPPVETPASKTTPPPKTPAPANNHSKKCICGERVYGDFCPVCGRKV